MAVEDDILAIQLRSDIFSHEEKKVSGLAKRAVDNGYETLSDGQKAVLKPFLTQPCEGVTDPGGYHNACTSQLSGAELLEAYEEECNFDSLLCEHCRDEANDLAAQYDSFMKD
ncbi:MULTISPECIES: hypothetical protein [unclassified Serratia (in: enterobacteria)]|uniref:hypothetical protein n=1 Tax=unclassified Serratia (in: enterobacteria) TaxID=2647522 RepID=UPI00307673B1